MRPVVLALSLGLLAACGGSTPPPPAPLPPPPDPAPSGPTRADFSSLARRLIGRCAAGGWIQRWRSEHEDVEVARPRVALTEFLDETGRDLDVDYLRSTLEARMQQSRIYEVVRDPAEADFLARGQLRRMAERVGGERIPVYVASLEIRSVADGGIRRRCESAVRGELSP